MKHYHYQRTIYRVCNCFAEISKKISAARWFNKTEDCIFPRSFIYDHCTIFQTFTIFQSRDLIYVYNIVLIYLSFPEVHTPFAYIRDFPRALFCILQVHCTIRLMPHPVFMTRTVNVFTHVTGYSLLQPITIYFYLSPNYTSICFPTN